jgi:hypothetical protein
LVPPWSARYMEWAAVLPSIVLKRKRYDKLVTEQSVPFLSLLVRLLFFCKCNLIVKGGRKDVLPRFQILRRFDFIDL